MTYKLAKKYYNTIMSNGERMWPKDWIYELTKRGKLTKEQYKDITGEDYPEEEGTSESSKNDAENETSTTSEGTSTDESGTAAGN